MSIVNNASTDSASRPVVLPPPFLLPVLAAPGLHHAEQLAHRVFVEVREQGDRERTARAREAWVACVRGIGR